MPDSAIAKVFPKEAEIRGLCGAEGPNGVINDWCGTAWAAPRRAMIITASGGHHDILDLSRLGLIATKGFSLS